MLKMTEALRKNDIKILDIVEAVLHRPTMYVGSVNEDQINTLIYENDKIALKNIPQIPALLKIFDEVISNSVDEAIRTNFVYATKIQVDFDETKNTITVKDNGRGLPIEFDPELNKWTPEIIFTTLHAGSNFNDDDTEKGNVVGTNGVGGSLSAIFSSIFQISTANGLKSYTQTIENHIKIIHKAKVGKSSKNFTEISYIPDFEYFKITPEAKGYLKTLYFKRVKDLSFAYPEITFYFNDEKISNPTLKAFLKQISENFEQAENSDTRIGVFCSENDFQQLSFVNGSDCKRGGTHVDYVVNKIIDHVRNYLKKKHKIEVKPIDIKSKLFILLSVRMKNPVFDSQTKERLTSPNNFKHSIDDLLSKKFLDSINKNEEIIQPIVETYLLKQQAKENIELKKMNNQKTKRVKVDNFFPACKNNEFLVLSEGLSAQGGLMPVLGRDNYSFFPLRGVPLNTLECPISEILKNQEMSNIIKILGIRLDEDKNLIEDSDEWFDIEIDGKSNIVNKNDELFLNGKWVSVLELIKNDLFN